jgi:hypothetical protein
MDTGILRDYVIIIAGGFLIVLLILAGVIGFLFFRQIHSLINTVKSTVQTTKEMNYEIKQAVKLSTDLINLVHIFKGKETREESKPSPGSS